MTTTSPAATTTTGFAILGPLRVLRAGDDLTLPARIEREILALLLAQAGHPVSAADLIAALWGQSPPLNAANTVHRHIGNLRRVLEPGLAVRRPGALLQGRSGGYRLHVDAGTLDLVRFRRLAGEAGRAAELHQDEAATQLYARALHLWRGRCADGFDRLRQENPIFDGIDREHAAVARRAARAARGSGRTDMVMTYLSRAAQWHPLDEPLQAEYLRALSAQGRRGEALARYRQIEQRLATRFGIDPSAELRAVHDDLRRSPSFTRAVSAGPAGTGSTATLPPAQLPADQRYFEGRAHEITQALTDLTPGDRPRVGPAVLVIEGMPGVGKTTLAVRLGHGVASAYPDGQLYAELRTGPESGPTSTGEILQGFLTALGVPRPEIPDSVQARAGLYRTVLRDKRVLVVLDGAATVDEVRALLPVSAGSAAIVTGRGGLAMLASEVGAVRRVLDVLPVEEARRALLTRIAPYREVVEPAAVDGVLDLTGRLPLALAVVGARVLACPEAELTEIVADLRNRDGRLALSAGESCGEMRSIFASAYRALAPRAAALYRLLPLEPCEEISVAAAAGLLGVAVPQARGLLGAVANGGLISETRPGRFRMHGLVRDHAAELSQELDDDDVRSGALARLLEHYRHSGDRVGPGVPPRRHPVEPAGSGFRGGRIHRPERRPHLVSRP
ncbi:BTAD domain-containing putative transcriptional regulator [Actinoplanes sp. NPDC049596]|uniref:AfsR/SARP family transcriptional regulator n=1 Tax=unclassified Actinoplanes TaxID=2626549 RepID=UPI003447548E